MRRSAEPPEPDHDVDRYARAVVAGDVPAGTYHRLACARHLRDREAARSGAFPFVFDAARADRFYRFAEQLTHYKGEWSGQRIRLEPHQRFRLGSLFAWIDPVTSLRRFRTAYNEIPRKNGKTLEAAIVALYLTFFDGEPGAECYCIATKREQARLVFNDCKRLVVASPELRARITPLVANLHRDRTASKLEPLGADRDSTDGLNPSVIITDEFHAQKNRGLIDVMETATGARRQPMNFQITTAGADPVSPCGDQHDYACKILDGVLTDDTFFAFIAHAEVDDDPASEATWIKANPNYAVSVKPADLRALVTKAIHIPPAMNAFKQKRLNLWVYALSPWLSLDGWNRGQSPTLPDLAGRPCWVGIDMSSKIDLTAVAALFPPIAAGDRWRCAVWALTPADTVEARAHRDRAPYEQWIAAGYLRTNPGNRIDQDRVRAIVVDEIAAHYAVQHVAVDPWNAGNLATDLESAGVAVIEVPQNIQQMSQPSKDFEADVLDGLVDAGGNPLMRWCVANAVVIRDNKDNIYPVKKRSRGRIDPLIAALLARKAYTLDATAPTAEDPDLIVA